MQLGRAGRPLDLPHEEESTKFYKSLAISFAPWFSQSVQDSGTDPHFAPPGAINAGEYERLRDHRL